MTMMRDACFVFRVALLSRPKVRNLKNLPCFGKPGESLCCAAGAHLSGDVGGDGKHGGEDAQEQETDAASHDNDHHRLDHVG